MSIDGMAAGFALGVKWKFSLKFSCAAAAATLILCFAAVLLGRLLQGALQNAARVLSPCALIVIGLVDFFKKQQTATAVSAKECLALGFAVGLDAAAANLSLCLMGHTALWIPVVFAATHFALVSLGTLLASAAVTKKMKSTGKIAGALLVVIGISKFFC